MVGLARCLLVGRRTCSSVSNPGGLLRRLNMLEMIDDLEGHKYNNLFNSYAVLLDLKDQSKLSIDLVNQAARYMAIKHPVMSSKIVRVNEYESYYESISQGDSFDNLQVLETQSDWTKLIKEELVKSFEGDLLWRLQIVKLPLYELNYNTIFLFTNLHAMGDAFYSLELIAQFLECLQVLLSGRKLNKPSSILPTIKQVDFSNLLVSPDTGNVRLDCNRMSKHIGNQFDASHGKINYFVLDNPTYTRLQSRLKERTKSARFGSLLTTIFCIALKKLFIMSQVDDIDVSSVQFKVLTSFRKRLNIHAEEMGVYTGELESRFTHGIDIDKFWRVVDAESAELHRRLDSNQDLNSWLKLREVYDQVRRGEYNENHLDFELSNLGKIRPLRYTDDSMILRGMCIGMPCVKDRISSSLFMVVAHVEGQLCFTLSYNESRISSNRVGQFVNIFKELVEVLNQ